MDEKIECVGGFEKIYDMKLGDKTKYDVFTIWRVPKGWIFGNDSGQGVGFTFVPYDEVTK